MARRWRTSPSPPRLTAPRLWLALTPLARELVDGPTPLFLAEAPLRGAGKGKLVAACLTPAIGPNGWTVASLPREDEELRKALTAYLSEQRAALVFDNVAGRLASPVLAKALTDTVWDDRTLGRSESVRLPVRCTWVVTANNPLLGDEIARRAVPIRLVPHTDRPELRRDFRHPELEGWIAAHRPHLLWALAVFVRAWQAERCPAFTAGQLGSYEAWARVIGGILAAAGYPDFLNNRESLLAAADPDTAAWEGFVAAWWTSHGSRLVGVKDLLSLAEEHGLPVHGDNARAQVTSLGMALGRRRDRYFGGYQVRQGRGRARREWQLLLPVTPRDTRATSSPELLRVARARARVRASRDAGEQASQVTLGVTDNGVLGSGALVRLREAPSGRVALESVAGDLVLGYVSGPVTDPAARVALLAATGNPARRDDLERILARMDLAAEAVA